MPIQVKEKRNSYPLGKASFIASLIALLLSANYWVWYWVWTYFGFYKSFGGDLSLTGIVCFGISVFVTPPIVIMALVGGILAVLQKNEKNRPLAIISILISILTLIVYSSYFLY